MPHFRPHLFSKRSSPFFKKGSIFFKFPANPQEKG